MPEYPRPKCPAWKKSWWRGRPCLCTRNDQETARRGDRESPSCRYIAGITPPVSMAVKIARRRVGEW